MKVAKTLNLESQDVEEFQALDINLSAWVREKMAEHLQKNKGQGILDLESGQVVPTVDEQRKIELGQHLAKEVQAQEEQTRQDNIKALALAVKKYSPKKFPSESYGAEWLAHWATELEISSTQLERAIKKELKAGEKIVRPRAKRNPKGSKKNH